MNKNRWILVLTVLLCLLIGAFYSYYYWIDTVDSYYIVKVIPPQPMTALYGGTRYTAPEIEIERLKDYKDDMTALEEQTKEAKSSYAWLLEEYDKELKLPPDDNPIIQEARMNAIKSLLEQEMILIRTTHSRSFKPEKAIEMISQHWTDGSLEDYASRNKIDIAIYRVPKL